MKLMNSHDHRQEYNASPEQVTIVSVCSQYAHSCQNRNAPEGRQLIGRSEGFQQYHKACDYHNSAVQINAKYSQSIPERRMVSSGLKF